MSYRKIEVDGNLYEYSIGKTHTKIRHVGAFKNEDVGKVEYATLYNSLADEFETEYRSVQVRPSDIASFIKMKRLKTK
jgi:hypothetical protein